MILAVPAAVFYGSNVSLSKRLPEHIQPTFLAAFLYPGERERNITMRGCFARVTNPCVKKIRKPGNIRGFRTFYI